MRLHKTKKPAQRNTSERVFRFFGDRKACASHRFLLTFLDFGTYSVAKWEEVGIHGGKALMFRGLNQVSLDAKGRFAIPARYREALLEMASGELIATVDRDRCLLLYPRTRWEEIERELVQLPSLQPEARAVQRMLLGHAADMQMDNHGRILLPPALRDYAELDHKVVMIGQGSRFELWSEARWDEVTQQWSAGIGMGEKGSSALEKIAL